MAGRLVYGFALEHGVIIGPTRLNAVLVAAPLLTLPDFPFLARQVAAISQLRSCRKTRAELRYIDASTTAICGRTTVSTISAETNIIIGAFELECRIAGGMIELPPRSKSKASGQTSSTAKMIEAVPATTPIVTNR